jgi:hypothetical protein
MPALALVTLLVALALGWFALVILIVDCNEDVGSECSAGGYGQFAIALTGVVLAFGALIAGLTGRSRPDVWLVATALTSVTWFLVIFAVSETG